jgi:UDPglucose--hexose-1-phosphate uridylyltransferase
MAKQIAEIRWNPLLKEWVAVAAHRQERPQMPKDWCPFCPGSGHVPDKYDVLIYPNDFPTFSLKAPAPATESTSFYPVTKAFGSCDVVLYHPDHNTFLPELSVDHIIKLIQLWQNRFNELKSNQEIKYIFIFENKGEVIGVTMPHPHGQIYSFPYIPPKIAIELSSSKEHFDNNKGECLFCKILQLELLHKKRIVIENDSFVAFVPFYARWPYEVHIYSKRHLQLITEIKDPKEVRDFASILKTLTQKYDNLFGFSFPYMMVIHQAPVNDGEYPYFHFHVEFYPPYRSKTKLKYLAGCETGAGTFINDTVPEDKAEELRRA